jgi:hypothetical protein
MHTITLLHQADGQTVHAMAESAVNNGIPMAEANPFNTGTTSYLSFERQYIACVRELSVADG